MHARIRRIRQVASERAAPVRLAWTELALHLDDLEQALGRLAFPGLQAHGLRGRLRDLRLALSTWSWRRHRLAGAIREPKDAILGAADGRGRR